MNDEERWVIAELSATPVRVYGTASGRPFRSKKAATDAAAEMGRVSKRTVAVVEFKKLEEE